MSDKEKKEKLPIWPMDDEQLVQWRKDKAEREERRKQELLDKDAPPSPERTAELNKLATEAVERMWATRSRSKPVEKVEVKVKTKKEKPKKEGRQSRLGQTKLIDSLLKEGKSEKEIFDLVREKIPQYPAEKLPKLIKLRQYHIKK